MALLRHDRPLCRPSIEYTRLLPPALQVHIGRLGKGGAALRLVEFLPDGKTEQITAYSPYYGTWLTDSGNQFILTNQPTLH